MSKYIYGILISVLLIMMVFLFGIGFHNVDLSMNMLKLNNNNLIDVDSNFNENSFINVYINGQNQMKIAYFLSIVLAFGIGLIVGGENE